MTHLTGLKSLVPDRLFPAHYREDCTHESHGKVFEDGQSANQTKLTLDSMLSVAIVNLFSTIQPLS